MRRATKTASRDGRKRLRQATHATILAGRSARYGTRRLGNTLEQTMVFQSTPGTAQARLLLLTAVLFISYLCVATPLSIIPL
jgi:hypothetical protein